jgi:APA family basic amino acid/polyamine antiporter
MAAVAVTFARYFIELTGIAFRDWMIASAALAFLTVVNCLGVRAGSTLQSVLMVLKIAALIALIGFGLGVRPAGAGSAQADSPEVDQWSVTTAFGAALVPVLFAYGGWHTANFIAGEMREPRKNLPRALVLGVIGVVVLYLSVNYVYVISLGVEGLAAAQAPASEVMRLVLGERGARLIAIGIALSTLGFLSQSILTAPRVYFAMAEDGLFFKSVGRLHPRSRVPVVAIGLQGAVAIAIACSGTYKEILNYVVSVDSIFFGVSAACLFALRKSAAAPGDSTPTGKTLRVSNPIVFLFIAAEWLVAASAIYKDPRNSAIGLAILLAGIPIYFYWRGRNRG